MSSSPPLDTSDSHRLAVTGVPSSSLHIQIISSAIVNFRHRGEWCTQGGADGVARAAHNEMFTGVRCPLAARHQ